MKTTVQVIRVREFPGTWKFRLGAHPGSGAYILSLCICLNSWQREVVIRFPKGAPK